MRLSLVLLIGCLANPVVVTSSSLRAGRRNKQVQTNADASESRSLAWAGADSCSGLTANGPLPNEDYEDCYQGGCSNQQCQDSSDCGEGSCCLYTYYGYWCADTSEVTKSHSWLLNRCHCETTGGGADNSGSDTPAAAPTSENETQAQAQQQSEPQPQIQTPTPPGPTLTSAPVPDPAATEIELEPQNESEPTACRGDTYNCGFEAGELVFVGRDPRNGCRFFPCPQPGKTQTQSQPKPQPKPQSEIDPQQALDGQAAQTQLNVCSQACSDEFLSGCMPYVCGQNKTSTDAWATCRQEIDSGVGPLTTKDGCSMGCVDTAAMAVTRNCGCDSECPEPSQQASEPKPEPMTQPEAGDQTQPDANPLAQPQPQPQPQTGPEVQPETEPEPEPEPEPLTATATEIEKPVSATPQTQTQITFTKEPSLCVSTGIDVDDSKAAISNYGECYRSPDKCDPAARCIDSGDCAAGDCCMPTFSGGIVSFLCGIRLLIIYCVCVFCLPSMTSSLQI